MDHLNQVLQASEFPETLVRKALTTNLSPPPAASTPQQGDAPKILYTPYIKGLSKKIEKVCAFQREKPVFRPMKTLKRDLIHASGEQDPRAEADRSCV